MSGPNGQTITVCGNVFRLVETIGRGSYGTVHKAVNLASDAAVAVKVVSKDKLKRPHERRSIEKEIETMRVAVEQYENGHPHIVRLLFTKESQFHIFIVLEYCAGGDISSHIKLNGGLSEDQARVYMAQLASGLQFLRSQNVIHRDLKPANLLLSSTSSHSRKLKIADFGFARELQSESMAESVVGSPLYMAPELLEFKSYDAKADLWSVGIILYEMLVNDHPFLVVENCHATNHLALRRNIVRYFQLHKKVVLPPNRNFSPECVELLETLLRPNPEERISFEDFFVARFLLPPRPTGNEESIQPLDKSMSPKQPLVDNSRFDSSDWVDISSEYVIVDNEYEEVGREVLDERDLETDFDKPALEQDISIEIENMTISGSHGKQDLTNEAKLVFAGSVPADNTTLKQVKHEIGIDDVEIKVEEKNSKIYIKEDIHESVHNKEKQIDSLRDDISGNVPGIVTESTSTTRNVMEGTNNNSAQNHMESSERALGISYQSFTLGAVALFVPTPHGNYIAFHEGCPHYYLSEESIQVSKREGRNPSYVLGCVVFIENYETSLEENPYHLRPGTPYHVVTVTDLSALDYAPCVSPKRNLSSNAIVPKLISFRHFGIGDFALFFQKSAKPQYLAFNEGCPNYYLGEESILAAKGNDEGYPAYICGEIIFIDSFQATEDFNPHRLSYGIRFHVVTVASPKKTRDE